MKFNFSVFFFWGGGIRINGNVFVLQATATNVFNVTKLIRFSVIKMFLLAKRLDAAKTTWGGRGQRSAMEILVASVQNL